MTHRDRVGDPPGRREAAGDVGHRQGFPTPSGGSPRRAERRLCGSLWSPDDLSPEELTDQVNAVLALLTEFAPRNQLEAMLGIQAIAIHNAAMECMRRAMVPDENHQLCDLYFKHAAKLCRIFVTQTEALTRNKPITGTTLPEYGHGIPWKLTKKASSATCDDC